MSISRQRELRRNMTPPERAMWRLLRPFRDQGIHFRRQVALGPYFVDFASHRDMLAIEVDGDTHAIQVEHDRRRDEYLARRGFRVLRFTNADVMRNPDGVFDVIDQALRASPPPRTPPRKGEGNAAVPGDRH